MTNTEAQNTLSAMWNAARDAIIAYHRVNRSDIKLPDFYWDHWFILPPSKRKEAMKVLELAYPGRFHEIKVASEQPASRAMEWVVEPTTALLKWAES